MDLNSGQLITRARVTLIPITENVIKAVNAMAEDQGIKGLKITNKRGIIYHPADRFAGVDHDPNIDPNYDEELDEDYDDQDDDTAHTEPEMDIDSDEEYDQINQEEINDLMADAEVEPTNNGNTNQPPQVETVEEDDDEPAAPAEQPAPEPTQEQAEPTPILRRSTRTNKTEPDRWTYGHNHKQTSMVSPRKLKIRFMEQAL